MQRLWDILNVKTRFLGTRKRNPYQEHIEEVDCPQMRFLQQFLTWLNSWRQFNRNSQEGLSKETFLAVGHSVRALIDLTKFCLEELGMEHVLLGKFQSDPLESRFGRYRQMNGGNYYLSVRQLAENERKIRAISLLKFSKCSVDEIKSLESVVSFPGTDTLVVQKFQRFLEMQLPVFDSRMQNSDVQVLYYVAGALVRSELNLRKCESCTQLLTKDGGESHLPYLTPEGEVTPDVSEFMQSINRGGLLNPSDLAFSIGVKCWLVFTCITDDSGMKKCFTLLSHCESWLFIEVVTRLLQEDCAYYEAAVTQLVCDSAKAHAFG